MAEASAVVLLVDDEPRILTALARTLRREGYVLESAEGAAAALAVLEARPVDVVLSDYKMPGSNGAELLATVRRRWPATRRLLLSGWSLEIPQREIEAAAPAAVLPKPWDDPTLKSTLREAVAGGP